MFFKYKSDVDYGISIDNDIGSFLLYHPRPLNGNCNLIFLFCLIYQSFRDDTIPELVFPCIFYCFSMLLEQLILHTKLRFFFFC